MIPNLAAMHPQVVHFVIVLTIIGAAFRVISLLGWPKRNRRWQTAKRDDPIQRRS